MTQNMRAKADGIKRSKKANGRLLLGKTWNDMPDVLPSSQAA